MSQMRKVAVVITARPSYSRIKTALEAIRSHPNLELQLIVAASALLDKYGSVVNDIQKDGFKIIEKVFMVLDGEDKTSMAKTTGLGVLELSSVFYNLQPDVVVTIADRFETLSTSIAAAYQNIPLAHIQGGEVTGNIDEKVRHANTKLADIHLVSSESAKKRVIRLGEDCDYVFNTGCPSIDLASEVIKESKLKFNPYDKYGGVGYEVDYTGGYIVVMQHPVTTEYHEARSNIEETLNAINELKIPTFWFWLNIDAGADGTSSGIRSYREYHRLEHVHFFKNMKPKDFLSILYNSNCLIGNSSVGIRECSYLSIPVVNIGSRQYRRERGNNVIDCGYNKSEIINSIKHWTISDRPNSSNIYGNGDAGKNIADILAKIDLKFHKTITY